MRPILSDLNKHLDYVTHTLSHQCQCKHLSQKPHVILLPYIFYYHSFICLSPPVLPKMLPYQQKFGMFEWCDFFNLKSNLLIFRLEV